MKVLHIIGAGDPGGEEEFFLRLMPALQRRASEISVLPVVKAGGWIDEQLSELSLEYETAPFDKRDLAATRHRLSNLARAYQPDLVYGWMQLGASCVPAGPWHRLGRMGGYYRLTHFQGAVDRLIGITPDVCRYAKEAGWPEDRVDHLPNFAPPPRPSEPGERGRVRARLGIDGNIKLLFLPGRLHAVKGMDTALHALSALDESFHLLIAGRGAEAAALRGLSNELGLEQRVHWLDWQSDLTPWALASDLWLVPSRHEPFGNVFLDAWAHGVPLVATRAQGPSTYVEDGVNGRLTAIGEAGDLAETIRELWSQPELRERLIQGGRETWRAKFSETKIIDAWMHHHRSLGIPLA